MDWIFDDDGDEQDLFGQPPISNASLSVPRRPEIDVTHNFASRESWTLLNSLTPEERKVLPQNLNQMQHRVLPTVLGTDECVVLSAPTGAGKTCVLDMAILRSLLVDGGARMYYVAPSKSLCRLQASGFQTRFRHFNLSVDVVTGDDCEEEDADEDQDQVPRGQPLSVTMTSLLRGNAVQAATSKQKHSIVICTPEKLEAETRKCSDEKLASNSKVLILVDEVHHLGERDRGATLELVLTRFLWAFRTRRENLRFVCVSATIPNVADVARWLCDATYFEFHQRPVPLSVTVLGFPKHPNRADFLFEQDLDRQVPEVLRTYGCGKPALIFVSSRKAAKDLAVKLREAGFGKLQAETRGIQTNDETLAECLRFGLGFHSAGLTASDRLKVENLFQKGHLSVVCCTSTLAVGVDLPANLVVIKSTRAYRGPVLGFQDLERATMVQMIGRAGRPGYDTEGTAVIMTSQDDEAKYSDLSQGLLAVSSQLSGDALHEGLNAEIVRGRLKTSQDCRMWWAMTFASISSGSAWDGSQLSSLEEMGCIHVTSTPHGDNSLHITPTATGRIASTHHLSLSTVASFSKACQAPQPLDPDTSETNKPEDDRWNLEAIARLICESKEFADLVPRRDQKKLLNTIAWTLGRFKSAKSARVATSADVAFQLLQARLGGLALSDNILRQNSNFVFERAPRLARALLKMLVDSKSNKAIVCALLCKCLDTRCWETDELGQLDGVGVKTKEKLNGLGLCTLIDATTPANATLFPPKALVHARTILAAKRVPTVSFVDSALVVSLLPATASAPVPKKLSTPGSEWWIGCVGTQGQKLLGWAETMNRIVVAADNVTRIIVFAIHRKFIGIDCKLVVDIDQRTRQCTVASMEGHFWDGFHLANAPSSKGMSKKKAPAKSHREKKGYSTSIENFFPAESVMAKRSPEHMTSTIITPSVQAVQPSRVQVDKPEEMRTKAFPYPKPALTKTGEQLEKPEQSVQERPNNQHPTTKARNPFASYAYLPKNDVPVAVPQTYAFASNVGSAFPDPIGSHKSLEYQQQVNAQLTTQPQRENVSVRTTRSEPYSWQPSVHVRAAPVNESGVASNTLIAGAIETGVANQSKQGASRLQPVKKFEDIFFL